MTGLHRRDLRPGAVRRARRRRTTKRVALVNDNPYGNGVALFTRDGGAARRFQFEVEAGMVGINVADPRTRSRTTRSAGGTRACSATPTCTAPRASASTRGARSSRPAGPIPTSGPPRPRPRPHRSRREPTEPRLPYPERERHAEATRPRAREREAMTDMTPMRIGPDRVVDRRGVRGALALRRPGRRPGAGRHRGPPRRRRRRRPRPPPRAARCRPTSGPRSSTGPPSRWPSAREEFARSIAAEAAKPIKTARVEADRAVDTFRFSAAVARTMAGEMVPLDASSAGVGKLGFVQRVPIGVVAAISPFNFPLNLVAHKLAPAIAVGLSGRAQAGLGHAAHRAARWPRCCSTSAACPTAGSTS